MTVESWREQRSYLTNAVSILEGDDKYAAFGKELRAALKELEPAEPSTVGFLKASGVTAPQKCGAVTLAFDSDGSLKSIKKGTTGWVGSLGGFRYQTLSSGNFTDFCMDYGNAGCKATTENPGCHNFHKPNMSSANPQYMVVKPIAKNLWHRTNADGGCTYRLEAKINLATGVHTKYGAPDTVWTEVQIDGESALDSLSEFDGLPSSSGGSAAAAVAAAAPQKTKIALTSTWLNKTTTRMAEACWVSFVPKVSNPSNGWRISSLGQLVDPADVVAHGATHLHAMGADGAMVYNGPDGSLSIASLDVPVVSTGIFSPFPTPGDNTSIAQTLQEGMHWNVQNNVWNVDYPQWYPFEGVFGYGNGGKVDRKLGTDASFRFVLEF
eukprot:SAG31_NODE_1481_length_8176_cov_3.282531_7_plen_381_part_00